MALTISTNLLHYSSDNSETGWSNEFLRAIPDRDRKVAGIADISFRVEEKWGGGKDFWFDGLLK